MLLAALMLQAVSTISGVPEVLIIDQRFPYTSQSGVDLGCVGGGLEGSRFPSQIYDRTHNERLTDNVSRCTGGYIHATEETTWKSWNVEIGPGGRISGRDLLGHKWRYERDRGAYLNIATGRSCGRPDYRDMCSGGEDASSREEAR